MSRLFSDVLPEWPLDEVEAGLASVTETDVLAALELAENGRRLNARDFMALVSPAASPYLETMARIARDVTVRQFGAPSSCLRRFISPTTVPTSACTAASTPRTISTAPC